MNLLSIGVAAALRIGPATVAAGSREKPRSRVTRNWVIYNKTASHSTAGGEASHAGDFETGEASHASESPCFTFYYLGTCIL